MNPNAAHLKQARLEGRVCSWCGWMIPKPEWKRGNRLCRNCAEAMKGVNIKTGTHPARDEPVDELER